MATVRVKRGRAKPLWFGHPWLFSQAIERVDPDAVAGDIVDVEDDAGRFIGRGFFHPTSQIAVRMLTRKAEIADAGFFKARLAAALELRGRLGLPSERTTAFRWVNAEGDQLPGLNIDVYSDVVMVQLTSLGMKLRQELLFDAIEELLHPRAIFLVTSGGAAAKEGFADHVGVMRGEAPAEVEFLEDGLRFSIEPAASQKTGAFLDQRDNHRRIGGLAKGLRVLDCYTYLGGFALQALRAGATEAVAVDISPRAIARAKRHGEWAGVSDRLSLVEEDVFRYLEAAPEASFDLVIVDPPKFAPNRQALDAALKGYRKLNALAMRAARPGALLATASCSQIVDVEAFERMLGAAAVDAGKSLTILSIDHQALDHPVPVGFPEGRYLKLFLARVNPA